MGVAERYRELLDRIGEACRRAGRDPDSVRLLGASKTMPPERVRAAWEAGLRLAGENRLQDALTKLDALADLEDLEWHFIGPLQSRKAREVARRFACVQSVDRGKIARLLSRHAGEEGRTLRVLVEVNVGGEESKSGCALEEAAGLVSLCRELPAIQPVGLMSLPPWTEDPEESRPYHRALRDLRDRLRQELSLPELAELSMGMTHDFEVAIEEGATIVRVGTALFGPRG
jgi:pyridoxal phosphate enzyme (YggS family)